MMTIYLAGPMRGIPKWNWPAFHDAARALRHSGHTVYSPAEYDQVLGITEDTKELPPNFMRRALKWDLSTICDYCDTIALLPGWEKSKGVAVELALAKLLGLTVITLHPLGNGKENWYYLMEDCFDG